jgi:Cu/Ag efflux protein CusF
MQKTGLLIASLGALTLGLTACSPKAPEPAAEKAAPAGSMAGMDMSSAAQATGPIAATGKVTAVDAAAGTVTLDHAPIPAVKWDAMTMQFTADPALLADIKVGDQVSFDLKSAAEKTVIVKLRKQ